MGSRVSAWPSVRLLDVRVDSIPSEHVLSTIEECVVEDRKAIIANVNAHALNLSVEYPWLRQFLNQSQVNFCDGFGVVFAARLIGRPIHFRITYADWMWKLAQYCQQRRLSLFFLGARPGVAEKAARTLEDRFPGLRIVGSHNGYFDKGVGSPENASVIAEINAARPDVLVMGLGMPMQEQWLMDNWDQVDAGVALTGGAVFDYISGDLKRAPRWMTDNGLEWLGRLLIEPRRLWKRYILGNPLFVWRVVIHDVLGRPLPAADRVSAAQV
jgi:N-acetylglucosaminyldiphosphoundecaprenol N-acetyl-beta-D-mannosaminyltransferase